MNEQRAVVEALQARGVWERRACMTVGLGRTSRRYQSHAPANDDGLADAVKALARRHPRYGYRRITALLRREGRRVNHKRVWALWRTEGLQIPRTRVRKRHRGSQSGRPTAALQRGHGWTYAFVYERAERGRTLQMRAVLDEYTRACHQIRVGYTLTHQHVMEALAELVAVHGAPGYLRSDNGGACLAARLRTWLAETGLATIHITPGHPWENGYIESFNGKLRDECLNEEVFWHERHAQILVER